ncbi:uncharacterized protein TA16395 [Theileria annulata]|uniref:Uncharacterized protein n=1 Tax=Theileria annulata TaxID=5874 RepID=Q4UIV7_THEAN|nr:uncharacterized protein TA16395 [Theileria annulata]CAI72982.1 hypothetical protein TA16395 [Theileria annulata]|eukprot:XP_953660.1 hypothetical protein TA16395 [Theileria annulata]
MTLLNLSNVVDQLGVSVSSLIARRNLLSFSINQLELLRDTCKKISRIDSFDSNYPKNQILTDFLRNGSRVLEESITLRTNIFSNNDLPLFNRKISNSEKFRYRHNPTDLVSNQLPQNSISDFNKFDHVLNDTLISFITILGNSGLFLNSLDFLRSILSEIRIDSSNYSGLVCTVGIINKCDLFRYKDFLNFTRRIFSKFTRNYKILNYINDLDITLLLFHKISMLYMSQALLPNNDISTQDETELLHLLVTSLEKVLEISKFRDGSSSSVSMKSINNLIQSIFLLYDYDKMLVCKLSLDKLYKINRILSINSDSHYATSNFDSPEQKTESGSTSSTTSIQIKNTSDLHLKVKTVLDNISIANNSYKDVENILKNKKILNEIRIGSSLYFVDLLIN